MRLFFVLFVGLSPGLGACATSGFDWLPVDEMNRAPVDKFPDADAVIVLHEETLLINGPYSREIPGERSEVHFVIYVRNEDGLRFADFRLDHDVDEKISELTARSIGPDGRITLVDASRVMHETVDSQKGRARSVVAIPQVEAGSFVELRYVVTLNSQWHRYFRRFIKHPIPVLQSRFRLRGTADMQSSYVVMNMDRSKVKAYPQRDGFTMKWALQDLTASEHELFAGDREFNEPWWSFTVASFRSGQRIWFQHQDWGAVFSEKSAELLSEDFHAGFPVVLDVTDCNLDCRIQRARDWMESRVALREGGENENRSALDILAAKEGNRYERARLLHRILSDAQVKVEFAWTAKRHESFNHPDAWNARDYPDLLLRIDDVEARRFLWLDPAAPGCAPGQLSEAYLQSSAVVIQAGATRRWIGDAPPGTMMRINAGRCSGHGLTEDMYRVTVDGGTGDAAVAWTRQGYGPHALLAWSKDKKLSQTAREKTAHDTLLSRHPRARLKRVFPAEKRAPMQVEQRLDFEIGRFGIRQGDQLTVPLNVLRSKWEGAFLDSTERRKFDFRISAGEVHRERFSIQIPVGYSLASVPKPTTQVSKLFTVTSRVEEEGMNLILTRTLKFRPGIASAADAEAVKKVFESLRSIAQSVLVLKKIPVN